ncbi:phasin family protein [Microvirga sp. VF16]|uniref:phasin family protein n=1 Tax=Microvirga sp. VF16 TaxID=2807101 RepID=UPI00193D5A69|nr:phasin family protein [Microvirga sp. VF16]QRM35512.1 phasin family protein [Microvirga sp. VF16]
MMPNRTIGQTPPDKANELFAQLLATANEAVDAREQLLAALSQELELLASLQEQHLLPVLEKHPETADLVRGARDDNQQTRVLLSDLMATPKDSDAFLAKVAELRQVFQQHIRNDKDELLPVVLKVLDEDEVEAVVEKVEEEIAEAEAIRRAAGEPRRTRRGRKQAAAVSDAGGTLLAVVEAAAEAVQDGGQEVHETVEANLHAASEIVDSVVETSKRQIPEALTWLDQASHHVQAVVQSNRILARGAGTITLEWFGLRQERLLKNVESGIDLLTCRSMPDVIRLQSALVRQNVEQMIDNSQRLTQLTVQVAQDASRIVAGQPARDRSAV